MIEAPNSVDYRQRMADERALRDQEAERYERNIPEYQHDVEIAHYTRILQPAPGKLILDAGGGTGRVARAFAAKGARVVLADLSLESIRVAGMKAARAGLSFEGVQCDLSNLPFGARTFDAVVCAEVLEHIPDPNIRVAILHSLFVSLRPGGMAVISVYAYNLRRRARREREVVRGDYYAHYFTPAEIEHEIVEAAYASGGRVRSLHVVPIVNLRHRGLGERLGKLGPAVDRLITRIPMSGWASGTLLLGCLEFACADGPASAEGG